MRSRAKCRGNGPTVSGRFSSPSWWGLCWWVAWFTCNSMLADAAASDDPAATTLRDLRRWWAIAGLVLFTATWKLWTPHTEFPQVPLFRWAGAVPVAVEGLCFGI